MLVVLVGADLAGECGKAGEVGEHHRDLAPLAAQPQFGFVLAQAVDNARGKIMAEGFLDAAPPAFLDQEPHDVGKHHREKGGGNWNEYWEPPARAA